MSARLLRHCWILAALALPRAALAQRIAEVQIAPPFMRMVPDAQAPLVATAYDLDGAPVNVRFRWSSSNINIATVGATDGMVRAITPGTALITVSAESEGRRVVTRASVQVLRLPPRPGQVVVVAPLPPDSVTMRPGVPKGAMPAMPAMPPGEPRRRMVYDSMVRVSVNCNEPFMNAANPMRACWDERATLRDSAFVPPERPSQGRCPEGVSGVMLLIQVNEYGRVDGVLPFTSSSCSEYTQAVVEAARRLTFNPAIQGGKPVRAWVRLHVRPQ